MISFLCVFCSRSNCCRNCFLNGYIFAEVECICTCDISFSKLTVNIRNFIKLNFFSANNGSLDDLALNFRCFKNLRFSVSNNCFIKFTGNLSNIAKFNCICMCNISSSDFTLNGCILTDGEFIRTCNFNCVNLAVDFENFSRFNYIRNRLSCFFYSICLIAGDNLRGVNILEDKRSAGAETRFDIGCNQLVDRYTTIDEIFDLVDCNLTFFANFNTVSIKVSGNSGVKLCIRNLSAGDNSYAIEILIDTRIKLSGLHIGSDQIFKSLAINEVCNLLDYSMTVFANVDFVRIKVSRDSSIKLCIILCSTGDNSYAISILINVRIKTLGIHISRDQLIKRCAVLNEVCNLFNYSVTVFANRDFVSIKVSGNSSINLCIVFCSTINTSCAISILINVRIKILRVNISSYQLVKAQVLNRVCDFLDYNMAVLTNINFVRSEISSNSCVKSGIVCFSTINTSCAISILEDMRIKIARIDISRNQFVKAQVLNEICDFLDYNVTVVANVDFVRSEVSSNSCVESGIIFFSTINTSCAISILINVRIKICRVDVSGYQFIARYAVNVICNLLDYGIAICTNVNFVRSKVGSDSCMELRIDSFSTVNNSSAISILEDMRIKGGELNVRGY